MEPHVQAAYAQLGSLGLAWTTLHCAGMCGPLVTGLRLGGSAPTLGGVATSTIAYQGGKATSYAVMGALAGLLGAALQRGLAAVTPWLGFMFAFGMLVAWWRGGRADAVVTLGAGWRGPFSTRWWMELVQGTSRTRAFRLGMVLALLPCMLVAWALTLAASTRSPVHGAVIMVGLTVMTTLPLLLSGFVARQALRVPFSPQRALLPISALWMALVSAAALEWIPHASHVFEAGGRAWAIMLW